MQTTLNSKNTCNINVVFITQCSNQEIQRWKINSGVDNIVKINVLLTPLSEQAQQQQKTYPVLFPMEYKNAKNKREDWRSCYRQ